MRSLICILAIFLMFFVFFMTGCVRFGRGAKTAPVPQEEKSASGENRLETARLAFQQKLEAAPGLTLSALRKQWGQVRRSVAHRDLTIYLWSRTVAVTPPPDLASTVAAAGAKGTDSDRLVFSCQAWFIVNEENIVVEATSKGQCLEYRLLPEWRPSAAAASAI